MTGRLRTARFTKAPGPAAITSAVPTVGSEGEAATVERIDDDAADQETGDDEEDVHPHEPARQRRRERVEHDHGNHRNRAQAIDVGTVTGRRGHAT